MHVLALLAADDKKSGNGAAGLVQIGILLLIPLAMYFLMIRPQRRKMRDQQAMQSSLEIGDEVLTNAGIYGFITGFEDDVVWVEVDDDVQLRVNRGFLQGKARPGGDPATGTKPTTGTSTTAGSTGSARITPTVKGLKSKAPETASDSADADAADRTTKE